MVSKILLLVFKKRGLISHSQPTGELHKLRWYFCILVQLVFSNLL